MRSLLSIWESLTIGSKLVYYDLSSLKQDNDTQLVRDLQWKGRSRERIIKMRDSNFIRRAAIVWLSLTLTILVAAGGATGQTVDTVWIEDFEGGWGSWYTDNGVWEIGVPTYGPDSAYEGSNCAALCEDKQQAKEEHDDKGRNEPVLLASADVAPEVPQEIHFRPPRIDSS